MKKHEEKFYIQALYKGLNVLECFRDIDEYGVTEIGELIDLPDSTVQRIINTLEMKGYLYQNTNNKKYRLTPRCLLNSTSHANYYKWKDYARKHMVTLNEFCDENVNLAVRHDNLCSYIELVESKQLLRPNFTLGDSYPIYCTALGRSLLSDLTVAEIELIIPDILEERTPFTLTDRNEVIKRINEIKTNQYTTEIEEFYLGLSCIGSPILGLGNKVIAALSVTAPKDRMDEQKVKKLIPIIISTTQKISKEYQTLFTPEQ